MEKTANHKKHEHKERGENKEKSPRTLKEALKGRLTEKELSVLKTSFDIVGEIAILEIPDGLASKEKVIAETLLSMHRNIRTVCKKIGGHTGEFRRQKMRILAGKRSKETIYKENNVKLKLHVENSYFSARLSTERKRIADMIRPGESVLVMFSGVSPYPVVFSKNTQAKEIYAVEKNPSAHRYAVENVKLNKATNIKAFVGDARDVVPRLGMRFDRVLMPLPKGGESFLDVSLGAAKKGAMLHFYDFLHEDDFHLAEQKILNACKKAGRKCRIVGFRKCGQQSPRTYRVVVDFFAE